jgi:hypothetical protein
MVPVPAKRFKRVREFWTQTQRDLEERGAQTDPMRRKRGEAKRPNGDGDSSYTLEILRRNHVFITCDKHTLRYCSMLDTSYSTSLNYYMYIISLYFCYLKQYSNALHDNIWLHLIAVDCILRWYQHCTLHHTFHFIFRFTFHCTLPCVWHSTYIANCTLADTSPCKLIMLCTLHYKLHSDTIPTETYVNCVGVYLDHNWELARWGGAGRDGWEMTFDFLLFQWPLLHTLSPCYWM